MVGKEQDEFLHAIREGMMGLQTRMEMMEGVMSKIAEALTRLAVLEERHAAIVTAVSRFTDRQEKAEVRLNEAENEVIRIQTTGSVLTKAVTAAWAVIGGGILLLAGKLIHLAFVSPGSFGSAGN